MNAAEITADDDYLLYVSALLGPKVMHDQIDKEIFTSKEHMIEFAQTMTRRLEKEWPNGQLETDPEGFSHCYDLTLARWWWEVIGSKGYTVCKEDA